MTTYQEWCAQKCEWCRGGGKDRFPGINTAFFHGTFRAYHPCAAGNRDAFEAELSAELIAAKERVQELERKLDAGRIINGRVETSGRGAQESAENTEPIFRTSFLLPGDAMQIIGHAAGAASEEIISLRSLTTSLKGTISSQAAVIAGMIEENSSQAEEIAGLTATCKRFAKQIVDADAVIEKARDALREGMAHPFPGMVTAREMFDAALTLLSSPKPSVCKESLHTEFPTEKRCTRCGGIAEWIEKDCGWRHAGDPFTKEYPEQNFCDRYGYPIEVKDSPQPSAPKQEYATCPECKGYGVLNETATGHDHCEVCGTTGRVIGSPTDNLEEIIALRSAIHKVLAYEHYEGCKCSVRLRNECNEKRLKEVLDYEPSRRSSPVL